MLRIGAHLSTRHGYAGAARTAVMLGMGAFQFFPKNPRSLELKTKIDWRDAQSCAEICYTENIAAVGHAPYPLNLAAGADQQELMREVLVNGLQIVEACGAVGLVVHFGKYRGADSLQGYQQIIQLLNQALQSWEGRAMVLIENQAGEGSQMGTTLDEMVTIRQLCDYPDKIGFCLDTCHAFASGLWKGHNWAELERQGQEIGYWPHLKAVHLNDSVYPSGSRKDRHARIGEGNIGDSSLKSFLQSSVLRDVPLILETSPGADGTHHDEIEHIHHLYNLS